METVHTDSAYRAFSSRSSNSKINSDMPLEHDLKEEALENANIPNDELKTEEAKELWKKIQERQGVNKWRPKLEEHEDCEGNIYNKKTYTNLQRRKELRRRQTYMDVRLWQR